MKLKKTGAAASGIVLVLTLAACTGGGDPAGDEDDPRGTLRIGSPDDISSWDTTTANNGASLVYFQSAYDSLLRMTPEGELVPMLATEYSYDDTNTVLTLSLASDVTFSDGEVFDAEAVKANMEYFKAGQGPQTSQLASVESVEVVDDETVTVTLGTPDPALLSYLSGAAGLMASPAAIEAGSLEQEPTGTGPYVMDTAATVAGAQYVFTAREDYWSPDLQQFDEVEFLYLDDTATVNALTTGQVDAATVEPDAIGQLQDAGLDEFSSIADWRGMIIFDRAGQLVPALADARVRRAINHALDRDALVEALQAGNGEPTAQIFDSESGAYVPELDDAYEYDPELARELLAEAGYADGFSLTVPAPAPLANTVTVVSQFLSEVGITVTPDPIPFEEYRSSIIAQQYPVAIFGYNLGDPWGNTIRNYVTTNAGIWNPFQSQTPELDEMISEVQLAGDGYQAASQPVNEYVVEEAWFAPFYRSDQQYYFDGDKIVTVAQTGSPVPYLYNYAPAS